MKTDLSPPRSDEKTGVQGGPEGPAEPAETSPPAEVKPAPKPKGKRAEGAPKAKAKGVEGKGDAPKPATPAPPDRVKDLLVRFVAVRARERYPETRRFAPGPVRALARSRIEEHPEVIESYRKNRRRGEQEALPLADTLAQELAGRAPEAETGEKK